jgi:hypothetical protein
MIYYVLAFNFDKKSNFFSLYFKRIETKNKSDYFKIKNIL